MTPPTRQAAAAGKPRPAPEQTASDAGAAGGAPEAAGASGAAPAPEGPTRHNFFSQLTKYFGVSFTQTFVEFGVFAALHGLGMGAKIANVFALTCSCSYNFIMNRNITFKASSNMKRSVALFVLLYCWNLTFSSTCLHVLPDLLGWSTTLVKLLTMGCQGCWGFLLSRYVIFR